MVLSATVFQRSPALAGLLRYLVSETINGRANTLKSFTVAVDALGRREDFDPASDSSARVQMGRLRKTLEGYYAKYPPVDGACIYLVPGSYVVRLDSRDIAYPGLPPIVPEPEIGPIVPPPQHPMGGRSASFLRPAFVLPCIVLCLIVLTTGMGYFSPAKTATTSTYVSPVLEIIDYDSGVHNGARQMSRSVANVLADDLSRFKTSRVRLVNGDADAAQNNGTANVYRLYSRLVTDKNNNSTLYLTINDAQTNVLIWSRVLVLPEGEADARAGLIPIISEINGPQGIVALYESVLTRDNDGGGYSCMLKYFEFARFHGAILERRVADCLEKPTVEPSLVGTMLGVRAMFEIERSRAVTNPAAAYQRSMQWAQAGVVADSNDAWANFAMARLAYLKKDCSAARFYTERTMEANPNSPLFSAALAVFAPGCNLPFAGKLLDQALATQSPYYPRIRMLLVLAAIAQDRPEKIDEIHQGELPLSRNNRSNHYLTEAMIAASKGNRAEAQRFWALFESNAPDVAAPIEEKLRNVITIPAVRQQVIDYVQNAGVTQIKKRGDVAVTPGASVRNAI